MCCERNINLFSGNMHEKPKTILISFIVIGFCCMYIVSETVEELAKKLYCTLKKQNSTHPVYLHPVPYPVYYPYYVPWIYVWG